MGKKENVAESSQPGSRLVPGKRDESKRRDALLLGALQNWASLDELAEITTIPRSTVGRKLEKFCKQNVLQRKQTNSDHLKKKYIYKLAETGKQLLNGTISHIETNSQLTKLWPWVKYFPTNHWRAYGMVAVLCSIGKESNLSETDNPNCAAYGDSQTLKTVNHDMICAVLGEDPTECLVFLPQARGRGLTARTDNRGSLMYESEAIQRKIMKAEEFSKAPDSVQLAVLNLMHGNRKIPVDNTEIEVRALILLESNFNNGHIGITFPLRRP